MADHCSWPVLLILAGMVVLVNVPDVPGVPGVPGPPDLTTHMSG